MRDTHAVGDRSEAIIMARLLEIYRVVLVPFGNGYRYDLVVDDGERFFRVQCKTGWLRNGAVLFNTCSVVSRLGRTTSRGYRGECDYFGVYCPDTRDVYLVPVGDVPQRMGTLRITAPASGQKAKIRWAKDYVLGSSLADVAQR